MKYMGSKRAMLKNGLGELLIEQANLCGRFFDPFSGSGVVAWHVAENTNRKVFAGDLQRYSVELANAILLRNKPISPKELNELTDWIAEAGIQAKESFIDIPEEDGAYYVEQNRVRSAQNQRSLINAYGGYYYSHNQATVFDRLIKTVPTQRNLGSLALACIIEAASQCAASPGHTAQPFQPKNNGLKAILDAWGRDPLTYALNALKNLAPRYAQTKGEARVASVEKSISILREGDLVFLDPPYSGVHYSRFYHVLETIARKANIEVTGTGRYPPPEERPKSDFSLIGKSSSALDSMLKKIASKKAKAIMTFPLGDCSNGLSGDSVKACAKLYFDVKKEIIKGSFSTLGGNNSNRPARQASSELVLLLEPR